MQCATLFESPLRWFPDFADTPRGVRLIERAQDYRLAAETQAKREGRSNLRDYLFEVQSDAIAEWDSRENRLDFVTSEEMHDWGAYCRKLARHLGLDFVSG